MTEEKDYYKLNAAWISVDDELPMEEGRYLVSIPMCDVEPSVHIAWYHPGPKYITQFIGWSLLPLPFLEAITHWALLPEPPSKLDIV